MYKVITFAPADLVDGIINAMSKAGAGQMGNYTHCAFLTKGQGNWYSKDGSKPAIGKVGEMTRIEEYKIEMLCSKKYLKAVTHTIKSAHTYEFPEIDVIRLESAD